MLAHEHTVKIGLDTPRLGIDCILNGKLEHLKNSFSDGTEAQGGKVGWKPEKNCKSLLKLLPMVYHWLSKKIASGLFIANSLYRKLQFVDWPLNGIDNSVYRQDGYLKITDNANEPFFDKPGKQLWIQLG